jgi:hypothetical protein
MYSTITAAVAVSAGLIFTAQARPDTGVVYQVPGNQAGYQAVDASGFRMARTTFTVPDGAATGQAGLNGIYLTTKTGRAAGCGWLGAREPNGVVGCFDEAGTPIGWVTLLPNVSSGDSVTVIMTYKANGRMKVTASDATTATSDSTTFSDFSVETWNDAVVGSVPSNTTPSTTTTLSSFKKTRLALMCGKAQPLPTGPWATQAIIITSNGQSSGQIIAAPTTMKRNAFVVRQQP